MQVHIFGGLGCWQISGDGVSLAPSALWGSTVGIHGGIGGVGLYFAKQLVQHTRTVASLMHPKFSGLDYNMQDFACFHQSFRATWMGSGVGTLGPTQ